MAAQTGNGSSAPSAASLLSQIKAGGCSEEPSQFLAFYFSFPPRECQPFFATDQCSLIALSPHSRELMGNTGITHQLLTVHFSFLPPFDLHIHLIAGVFQLHVQGTALSFRLHQEIFVLAELLL